MPQPIDIQICRRETEHRDATVTDEGMDGLNHGELSLILIVPVFLKPSVQSEYLSLI